MINLHEDDFEWFDVDSQLEREIDDFAEIEDTQANAPDDNLDENSPLLQAAARRPVRLSRTHPAMLKMEAANFLKGTGENVLTGTSYFMRNCAVSYALYSITLKFQPDLASPWGYLPVGLLTTLLTVEEQLYRLSKQDERYPALSQKHHELVTEAKEFIDAGIAASTLFIGESEEVDPSRVISMTTAGISVAAVSSAVKLMRKFGGCCLNHKSKGFQMAAAVASGASTFAIAAGAVELLCTFLEEVDIDGHSVNLTGEQSAIAQYTTGGIAGLVTLAALAKNYHAPTEVIENLIKMCVHLSMGLTMGYDIYTTVNPLPDGDIPNAPAFGIAGMVIATALPYLFVIAQLLREKHAVPAPADSNLSADDFELIYAAGDDNDDPDLESGLAHPRAEIEAANADSQESDDPDVEIESETANPQIEEKDAAASPPLAEPIYQKQPKQLLFSQITRAKSESDLKKEDEPEQEQQNKNQLGRKSN